jgi:nitrate/TMAO reductase-like tetraheme cytochrome c subunit
MTNQIQDTPKKNKLIEKIFGFIGIYFPRNKNQIIYFSKRFLFFLLFLLIASMVLFTGFVKFSTSPTFCGTCHIMKPFYNAWKTSKHNMVSCVDCHYPPGFTEKLEGKIAAISQVVKYVTRTYGTKPYAEIEDASCLREGCHEKRLLQGKVVFKRGIIFDHVDHLTGLTRGKKLKCTSCHSQIVVGNHISVTEETCFLCHFKNIDLNNPDSIPPELKKMSSCTNCHAPPKGDIKIDGQTFNHADFISKGVNCLKCHSEVVQGKGEVPQERCYNCHNKPEIFSKYNDDVFLHKTHVTEHKVECSLCHQEIKHKVKTSVSPIEMSCDSCHQRKHEGIKNMYMGKSGKGLPDSPNPMYIAQVDCVGCHIISMGTIDSIEFQGKTLAAGKISCKACHGNDYDDMVETWKKDIVTKLTTSKELLNSVESLAKNIESENDDVHLQIKRLLNDSRYNIHFVEFANGVHNPDYALDLLDVADKNLDKIKELIQKNNSQKISTQ